MSRGGWDDDREVDIEAPAPGGRGASAPGGESPAPGGRGGSGDTADAAPANPGRQHMRGPGGEASPAHADRHDLGGPAVGDGRDPGSGTGAGLGSGPDRDVPIVWRDRVVSLSSSARDTLRIVGTFRTVAIADLARTRYAGDRDRMERDLRSLARSGWLERHTAPGRHGGRADPVVTLSREGRDVAQRYLAADGQTLHWGLVKPKEQAHDAALYRMADAAATRLERAGSTVRRVVLDAELKGQLAARRNAPGAPTDPEVAARALHLRVVNGTVQIPDVRLEYETREGTMARVDLELATEHYKPSQVAAKVQAGFTIYAPASHTSRLSAALEDRGVIAEIFSL